MSDQQNKPSVRQAAAVARLFILAVISAAITAAVFFVDEYKPLWVLIVSPAVTVFLFWRLINRTRPGLLEPHAADKASLLTDVLQKSLQRDDVPQSTLPRPQTEYAVFQDCDSGLKLWPLAAVLVVLLALMYLSGFMDLFL